MTKYFQGESVKGRVHASVANNFRDVVDTLRICPVLRVTRKQFLAMRESERNEVKRVPYFVPACFRESPSERCYAEATHCNLIMLDIDPEKVKQDGKWVETGRYPAAPFVNNPQSLYTALAGLNFAAYVTASSTPEKPRMRIVVDADELTLEEYPQAVRTIAAMLGLPSVTTESLVPVQPMFLPTVFSDSPQDYSPLIAYVFDQAAFTRENLTNSFDSPDEPRTPRQRQDDRDDALMFLRAPMPEVTLAIAEEALKHIDADCSYHEWLEIAAALKHQFQRDQLEDAYQLFDEWSSTGKKYAGDEETKAKWDSLRSTPIGRVPVTIRSLLRHAANGGWNDTAVKDKGFAAVNRFFEECGTVTELMEQGVQKILAAPQLSFIQESVLINNLVLAAKQRFAYVISSSAVKKDLKRIQDKLKAESAPDATKAKEPAWAKGVCYISAAGQFYRHRTGEKYRVEQFNAVNSRHLLPSPADLKEAGIPVTPASLSKPIVPPADYALNFLKIPAVYDYEYDPSQPTEMFFVRQGKKFVNTYIPSYPALDYTSMEACGVLFEKHLANLVKEPDYRRTLLDYMAFMVQFPGRKIRWAVLLQSAEGAGKTFFAEAMKAVLGKEHVQTIDGSAITKGWNEWAFGRQLVVIEEIRVAGTNRHEIMNALKPLVTNDDISVNERCRNTRETRNISNYMMFSNHHDALALTPNDRRYFVVKSPLQSKAQVLALGTEYFSPLFAMLRDKPGALRAYLNEHMISPDFRPDGHAPRTVYVEDLIQDSANDVTAAVRRLIKDSETPLVQFDILSGGVLMEQLTLEPNLRGVTAQSVAHVLREEGYRQIGRHVIGADRHYLWIREGVDQGTAHLIAEDRVKKGVKNMHMDIFF